MDILKYFLFLMISSNCLAQVDLVRVDKSERRMELLEKGVVIRHYKIALGDAPIGHKQKEGDERTPEGRYILDYRNPNSSYFKSLHVSYPNKQDLATAKAKGVDAGGMIMIHGHSAWTGQMAVWLLTMKICKKSGNLSKDRNAN
jgi:murein L,D-transpeptidase YafK